jgi:hypothetical protein
MDEALIVWTYDNIIYTRRRMIQNIFDECRNYKNEEQFSDSIDKFLKISNVSINLNHIVEQYDNWKYGIDEADAVRFRKDAAGMRELRVARSKKLKDFLN